MIFGYIKNVSTPKVAIDTLTATASSVGVLSFLGVTLSNWVMILTCVWFCILILKFVKDDIVPMFYKKEKDQNAIEEK